MPTNPTPAPPLVDPAAATPGLRTLGTGAQQAAVGSRVPAPANISGATYVDDGAGSITARRLTLDDINPAFAINSFSFNGVTNPVEIGTTVSNPAFSASYNRTASTVKINDGVTDESVVLPGTSFAYNAGGLTSKSYSSNTINHSQGFTLEAGEGGPVKTSGIGLNWQPRVYYAKSTIPGSYNEAFVEGLANNPLGSGRQRTVTFTTGAGEYMHFAFPSVYGGSPSNFLDDSTGFAAGFSIVATVAVTAGTAGAPTNNYDIWRSDVANLGTITIRVT